MATAPMLGRAISHLRLLRLQQATVPSAVCLVSRRPCFTTPEAEPNRQQNDKDEKVSTITYDSSALLRTKSQPRKNSKWENSPDYRKWKDKEEEIFRDIDPITLFVKDILHSNRYMDGERLTSEDEKFVLEKILAYHPHSEDKIGCGLDSIMVDRHPQYRNSRCLFVVRTDGGWIDFSYQKCIRAYIRKKFPSHAEKFIKEHYKRGSSGLLL